jgi:hypothetical protein
MKKLILAICSISVIFTSCSSSRVASFDDDVYANPTEEKRLAAIASAEKAKKEADQKQVAEEARLAQKAKDDANPLYKDPEFNKDDYYDYEYASRVRRFHQPVQGTGYYDNYYTNNYWYSGNPAMYGNSIYANPTWGMMPSNQFNGFNSGFGLGYNTGYGNWNNNGWGNNGWGNNGWNNNSSNAYWAGYNQGYNNGWYGQPYGYNNGWNNGWNNNGWGNNGWNNNNGWGYYNSHDVNSGYSHVGPRGSMTGGNSSRSSYGGMSVTEAESASRTYFQNVIETQETTPKFTESPRRKIREAYTTTNSNSNASQGSEKVTEGTPTRGNTSNANSNTQNEGGLWNWTRNHIEQGNNSNNSNTATQQNSGNTNNTETNTTTPTRGTKVQGGKINETPATNWDTNTGNSRNNGNSGNSGNSGSGTSTPRGGDSGGTSRPR